MLNWIYLQLSFFWISFSSSSFFLYVKHALYIWVSILVVWTSNFPHPRPWFSNSLLLPPTPPNLIYCVHERQLTQSQMNHTNKPTNWSTIESTSTGKQATEEGMQRKSPQATNMTMSKWTDGWSWMDCWWIGADTASQGHGETDSSEIMFCILCWQARVKPGDGPSALMNWYIRTLGT